MSFGRRWCGVLIVSVAAVLLTGCGDDPPTKEIQQAQQAIDTARSAEADRYAHDEFAAALAALKRSQDAVVARDYRQALNDALDARDRAQTASRNTVDNKARTKTDADHLLHETALALVDARAKLRAAEGHRPPRLVMNLRRDIVDAETRVQEARTAFDAGDYLGANELLGKAMQILKPSLQALETGSFVGRKNLPPPQGR
jgi:hypothetical protein